jgi:hypothetical protein
MQKLCSHAQAVEYLLVAGGAVLVGAIVIAMMASASESVDFPVPAIFEDPAGAGQEVLDSQTGGETVPMEGDTGSDGPDGSAGDGSSGELPECNPGDFTGNGQVSAADLSVLATNWNRADCTIINECCQRADITGDGNVSAADLAVLASEWNAETGPCTPGELACDSGHAIELYINEVKNGEKVSFSLDEASIIEGDYSQLLVPYSNEDDADYTLRVYNASGTMTAEYGVYSGRFIYFDSFEENSGGMHELDEGLICTFTPYSAGISEISVFDGSSETTIISQPDISALLAGLQAS